MADQVPTRRELIQQRRRSSFVGRQGELISFTEALGKAPGEVTQFLFHIHGPAGVGKSTLVRQMETGAQERQACTGYVDESAADVLEALEALSGQFAQQGLALKDFDKALAAYRQRRHEAAAAAESLSAEAVGGREGNEAGARDVPPSPGGVVAAQVGLVALGMIPGVGAFTGALDPNQVAAGAGRLKGLGGRFRSHDDLQMVLAPLKALTPVFLKDLAEVARRRPWVVLFFDTYERIGPLLDVWLRDTMMLARYGDVPANVLVVLAGQTRLDVRVWADWLDLVVDLPLEVFTEAEARRYLAARHISDEQVVEVILRLSGRLPVLLSLLAEARPNTAEEVGDPTGTAVERFLKWETDPARRATALACALPAELDEDVYRAAAEADNVAMFDWLRSLPFVTERAGRCRYHDVVRDAMLRLQRQQSPARWAAQHTRLADFHQDRRTAVESGIAPENGWWRDASWREHRLQETYHRLCANPQAALPEALRELLDACDQGLPVLRRWIQTLNQVSQDTDAPEITVWAQRLYNAMSEQMPGIAVSAILLASGGQLSSEGRAFAYMLQGRDHRRASQHEAALTNYNRSLELNPQTARACYGRGMTYLLMKRYQQALIDFSRATELKPDCDWIIAGRGLAYRAVKRYDDALTDFNRAIEIDPEYIWAISSRGHTYYLMERYDDALTDFNRAIEIDPEYIWAITGRGQTYHAMKRYDDALTDHNRAIEIDPEYTWAITGRGQTYHAMKRYDDALTDHNRAIEIDPEHAWAITGRGQTYRATERYDDALTDFNRAIEIDPKYTWAITNRGQTYHAMERYDDALTDHNRAIEIDPEYTWAITGRGQTYRATERYDDALTDFNRAIEIDPKYTWPITNRGQTYHAMERYDDALTDYNRAIEIDPEYTWAITGRGQTYHAMKRYDDALTDYNRAIEIDPESVRAITSRGQTYHAMERYDDALTDHNRAIEIDPENPRIITSRGQTYHAMERYDDALTDYNRAIEIDPESVRAITSRGQTYHAMERYDDALTDHNRAIEIDPENPRIIAIRGEINLLIGRYDEALSDLNRAIGISPEQSSFITNRGETYRLTGRYGEALNDFNRAIEIDSKSAWAMISRGQTYRAMKRYNEALVDFNRAIKISPNDGWIWLELAVIFRLLGKGSDEFKSWRKAEETFTAQSTGNGIGAQRNRFNLCTLWCARSEWEKATSGLRNELSKNPPMGLIRGASLDLRDMQRTLALDEGRTMIILRMLETCMPTPPDNV